MVEPSLAICLLKLLWCLFGASLRGGANIDSGNSFSFSAGWFSEGSLLRMYDGSSPLSSCPVVWSGC